MQEHFNENYMDSSKCPKANFVGNIQKFSLSELTEYEKNHKIIGVLTIRGIEKNITINSRLKKTDNGLSLKASFSVLTSDFDIQVPKVVRNKISKEIKIKVDYELIEKL
jgi:polyisoprenoid-binding protein YceI